MDEEYVILKCIKQGGKLRVRILNAGYYNEANCQFPKAIRVVNRHYKVKPENIKLVTRTNKWFYSVKYKDIIILDSFEEDESLLMDQLKNVKIFEDETCNDCCICLDATKDCVFIPCGHFYCCTTCATSITKCPICRAQITNKVNKDLFG